MFIDMVDVSLIAGRGGDGCVSFRREKYIPYGGPDGGNGGNGGNIYFEGDPDKVTLLDLSYTPRFKAGDGKKGLSNNRSGKCGEDLVIKIPLGTLVFKNGKFFADFKSPYERILIVKGGKGGRGNFSFKTNRRTTPRISEKGSFGEIAEIKLELRLIADVGFVGLPNAGKSSLLSKISAARPKIADYPFTTLSPNLGVVEYKGKRFVVADIPGIIEGAHKGKGLGLKFLRHIKRTKIIVHIIDISDNDSYRNYKIVNSELEKYSEYILKKHIIVVLNKIDLLNSRKCMKSFEKERLFEISAITGHNVDILIEEILKILEKLPVVTSDCEDSVVRKYTYEPEFKINIKNGVFVVTGTKIESLTNITKFNEDEALMRYQNILEKMGLNVELEKMGAKIGDSVRIGGFEFIFEK
jgi:GTP-binding protein